MKSKYERVEIEYLKFHKKEAIFNFKSFNYGLALLKSILSFSVVISHNFKSNPNKNKIIFYITHIRLRHVPAFFIMSFCFVCNNILSLKIKNVFRRLERLLIPYIIWPIVVYTINHFFNYIYKTRFLDSFQMLKIQFLWGSNQNKLNKS